MGNQLFLKLCYFTDKSNIQEDVIELPFKSSINQDFSKIIAIDRNLARRRGSEEKMKLKAYLDRPE